MFNRCLFILLLVIGFVYSNSFCDDGINTAQPDSAIAQRQQSNYRIVQYVTGSGGINFSHGTNKTLAATAGESYVGYHQGPNQHLYSGFWYPGMITTDVEQKNTLEPVKTFELHQNFPNPFNPTTTIRYDLPDEYVVNISIFNVNGQRIRLLTDHEIQGPGSIQCTWNGLDDDGEKVSSGVYLCKLSCEFISRKSYTNNLSKTIKLLLVK